MGIHYDFINIWFDADHNAQIVGSSFLVVSLQIPVYPGSNVSMLGKGSPESGFHGEEGLGNVVASEPKGQLPTPKEEHAANAILQLANQFKGQLF